MIAVMKQRSDAERTAIADLKKAGLAATRQRVALLCRLRAATKPTSVEQIAASLRDSMNLTTIYRGLEQLITTRLARRVDLGKNHGLYEAVGHHHHHVVCRMCGRVEDVPTCPQPVTATVLKGSELFSEIDDHSLEFFGTCIPCKKTA